MIATCEGISYVEVAEKIDRLAQAVERDDENVIRCLEEAVPIYRFTSHASSAAS